MKGCDSASPLDAIATALKAAGIGWVGRYYSHNADDNPKNLTPGEAIRLSAAGLQIVSIFEANPTHASYFSQDQAAKDAARAFDLARKCGQPAATAIYFTVDYDASASAIADAVVPYFGAVKAALGGTYKVGAYGSGAALTALQAAGYADYLWLSGAMGWSGSRDFTGADIAQGAGGTIQDVGIDFDESGSTIFGAWGGLPAAAVTDGLEALAALIDQLVATGQAAQSALANYRKR